MSSPRNQQYQGFEQGPIRPPSESNSLLLRLTRNCPWNRCTFCGLYKGQLFSCRPVEHVLQDIEAIRRNLERVKNHPWPLQSTMLFSSPETEEYNERIAFSAARNWLFGGCKSVFLQDSNSLIMKPADLLLILHRIREVFPQVERITSYARSHTIDRISAKNMTQLATAGLNRIHIGLESGCDEVLQHVRKGANQDTHIRAGRKVKAAGMELSTYYMPGLGGKKLSFQHALDSAEALNKINPHFIRLRTLALPNGLDLAAEQRNGCFAALNDLEILEELHLFLQKLEEIESKIKSDHILNLFEEIDGVLPHDKKRMLAVIDHFFNLDEDERLLFRIGRRTGLFRRLEDRLDAGLRRQAEGFIERFQVNQENIDLICAELMKRFI